MLSLCQSICLELGMNHGFSEDTIMSSEASRVERHRCQGQRLYLSRQKAAPIAGDRFYLSTHVSLSRFDSHSSLGPASLL
jgi:hypothetical protein